MDDLENMIRKNVAKNKEEQFNIMKPLYRYELTFPRQDKVYLVLYNDTVVETYISPILPDLDQLNFYSCPLLDPTDIFIEKVKEWNGLYESENNNLLRQYKNE